MFSATFVATDNALDIRRFVSLRSARLWAITLTSRSCAGGQRIARCENRNRGYETRNVLGGGRWREVRWRHGWRWANRERCSGSRTGVSPWCRSRTENGSRVPRSPRGRRSHQRHGGGGAACREPQIQRAGKLRVMGCRHPPGEQGSRRGRVNHPGSRQGVRAFRLLANHPADSLISRLIKSSRLLLKSRSARSLCHPPAWQISHSPKSRFALDSHLTQSQSLSALTDKSTRHWRIPNQTVKIKNNRNTWGLVFICNCVGALHHCSSRGPTCSPTWPGQRSDSRHLLSCVFSQSPANLNRESKKTGRYPCDYSRQSAPSRSSTTILGDDQRPTVSEGDPWHQPNPTTPLEPRGFLAVSRLP